MKIEFLPPARAELTDAISYYNTQGEGCCEFIREDARHSWWGNPSQNKRSSIPRHTEINGSLARKICKDLGIEQTK